MILISTNRPWSVCLWHLRQWKRLGRVMVGCTLSITHCLQLNLQLRTIGLVRTCRIVVSALLCGNWQDYYLQDASRGHSTTAELLVTFLVPVHPGSLGQRVVERVCVCSAFFVKEYFPVPSSGGNQCKNRHAPFGGIFWLITKLKCAIIQWKK